MNKQPNNVTPKMKQFIEELNVLLDKYQYNLSPRLVTTNKGIFPQLSIEEKIPPKTVNNIDKPTEENPSSIGNYRIKKPKKFINSKTKKLC